MFFLLSVLRWGKLYNAVQCIKLPIRLCTCYQGNGCGPGWDDQLSSQQTNTQVYQKGI